MDSEIKKRLKDLLWKYKKVFRRQPGLLTSYEHTLKIKEGQPFLGRSCPIPMKYRGKVKEEIQRILDMDVIERSKSPYLNPIVPVIKKDGTVRLCLDAWKLNEVLIEDWERPEPAEMLFQRCRGVKVMSSLDMTSSFWQVPLDPSSRKYTAFQHQGKIYEFRVVPFGLKTSTAAPVRGLDHALQGIGDQQTSPA